MTALETWGFVGVFVAAAVPWLEILLVVPAGVAAGLPPAPVGAVAFVGNALPVLGIIVGHDALRRWLWRRRGARGTSDEPSGRARRARHLLHRYGLPVLALAAPAVTGVHLAAFIALVVGAERTAVAGWMLGSLAAWTIVVTGLAAAGVDLLGG